MNKYQEALDKLIQDYNDLIQQSSNLSQYYEWYDTQEKIDKLQELVDKEIPMKLVGDMYHRRCRLCGNPNLNTKWTYGNYCSGCGQKIDWSDEE